MSIGPRSKPLHECLRVVLLAYAIVACRTKGKEAPFDATTPSTPSASATAAPSAPPQRELVFPPAGGPGPAYVRTGRGIAVVAVDGSTAEIRNADVHALRLGADGHAYFDTWEYKQDTAKIYRLDGAKPVLVASVKKYDISTFAVASDGTVFAAAHHDELHTIRAGKSTVETLTDSKGIKALATTEKSLVLQDAGGFRARPLVGTDANWKRIEMPNVFASELVCTAPNAIWASEVAKNVNRFDATKGAFERYAVTEEKIGRCRASGNGLAAVNIYDSGTRLWHDYLLIDATGASKRGALAHGMNPEASALDDGGRTWSVFDGKLSVVSAKDAVITTFEPATVAHLRYLTSGDDAIVVVGAGPALPTPSAQKTMTVKGKLIRGQALANTKIELCQFPRTTAYSGGSPCTDGGHFAYATTTDAAGAFSMEVPVEHYGVSYFDRRWTVLGDTFVDPKEPTTAGKGTVDLGTIRLK